MKFLLDTSTCISHLRGRSAPVTSRLIEHAEHASVCSVVVAELLFGAQRSKDPVAERAKVEQFLSAFPSLAFDDAAAAHAAKIRSELAIAGAPIGPYDLLIASIAIASRHTLVTSNVDEFRRVSGLVVQDWRAG